jgi:hypothetical protein
MLWLMQKSRLFQIAKATPGVVLSILGAADAPDHFRKWMQLLGWKNMPPFDATLNLALRGGCIVVGLMWIATSQRDWLWAHFVGQPESMRLKTVRARLIDLAATIRIPPPNTFVAPPRDGRDWRTEIRAYLSVACSAEITKKYDAMLKGSKDNLERRAVECLKAIIDGLSESDLR